ncbi:MAG: PEP-CTERM sorting domain-containing protein [Planctomycetes bacterium]|nr:PEP-CTERM sorting domain-containing protein [Planctomycetota bacterium]
MFQFTCAADGDRQRCVSLGAMAVLAAVMLLGITPTSKAAYESFDSYTVGSHLDAKAGGFGWSGAWSAFFSAGFTEWNIAAGGLDPSANRLQFVRGAGSRLDRASFELSRSATRSIGDSPNSGSGPIYFGFYFKQDAALGADSNPNQFLLEWKNSAGRYVTFGILGDEVFGQTGTGQLSSFDRKVSNADLIADGQTYRIVVKFEQDAGGPATSGGGTAEKISIFVNPPSDIEGTPDFVYTGGYSTNFSPGQTFTQLRMFGDYYNGQTASVDRIVITDNFAAAYIPEPTSALLLGAAAPLLVRRKRRARGGRADENVGSVVR